MMARIALLLILLAPAAWARDASGALGIVQSPNSGRPAMAAPGESFPIQLRADAELTLTAGGTRYPLETTALSTEPRVVTAVLPDGIAPGRYTLEARSGDETELSPGAVFVRSEPFGDYYVIAHLGVLTTTAPDELSETIHTLNTSDAAFALLSGIGEGVAYAALLPVLEAIAIPTFVAPPAEAVARAEYQRFFGPSPSQFEVGMDAYLSFALSSTASGSDLRASGNRLYPLRRAARPRRWSIGLCSSYTPFADMRAQWTLFSDDPLDYLLAPHPEAPTDDTELLGRVPWGETALVYTPPLSATTIRIIDVTAAGLKFRPLAVAPTGDPS